MCGRDARTTIPAWVFLWGRRLAYHPVGHVLAVVATVDAAMQAMMAAC